MKPIFILTLCILLCWSANSQVQVNRYAEPKIFAKGISGKSFLGKEVTIPAINMDKVLEKWDREKIQKFAEPILVDIAPLEQGLWERFDGYVVNRIKITAQKAHSLTVYLDKLKLSKNAEIYIYNSDGTILTGPITEKENITTDKLWASNVFQGNTVIIEFKAPAAEEKLNEIHIRKILYGISPKIMRSPKDSLNGPGFGLSSSCNVNVVCVSGWDQERRAVAQVVDEGGGWCSASLIMNTCNTLRPYVLTANHCIEQNGNLVNTNNSTFEFLWFSPTCTPTTNTSTTLLFNGATIRSRWEQTDFALLELNQAISQNSNLTFLGWSRSSTPPNSSVGIHHPAGDIMKVSIENSTASVGNVRTFLNTAWRVQWDLGTIEGGSSGSPLFDQNSHKVIGQEFSNTQPTSPPCNQPTGGTNYGRFDISWDGGGTSATRLRDWLDPINTAASTTNTTEVSNLIPVSATNLEISGNNIFCAGTSQYTLNVPAGTTVSWESSNTAVATVSPSGNPATVTKGQNGVVTITATINVCNLTLTVSKVITVGNPTITAGSTPLQYWYGNPSTDYNNVCSGQNFYTDMQVGGATSVVWNRIAASPSNTNWSQNGNNINFYFWSVGQTAVFRINASNACGTITNSFGFRSISCGGGGGGGCNRYKVSPNPASGSVKVIVPNIPPPCPLRTTSELKDGTTSKWAITEIKLYDNTGNIKQVRKEKASKQTTINLAGYKPGVYFIEISDGNYKEKQQIIIQ